MRESRVDRVLPVVSREIEVTVRVEIAKTALTRIRVKLSTAREACLDLVRER